MSAEDRVSPPARGDWREVVQRARRHIETRLADPALSVVSVAAAAGCSRATLYRAMAEQGLGVADLMRELRLRKVRALLETAGIGVAEAASVCGFVDTRTLQRQCKARFGLSPTDLARRTSNGRQLPLSP